MEDLIDTAVSELHTLSMTDNLSSVVIIVLLVIAATFIFTKPIRLLIKLVINTLCGFVALIAVNWVGAFIGVSIGVNWLNAVIVGFLGVPGVALLFLAKWLVLL